jgi:hypothetical protein
MNDVMFYEIRFKAKFAELKALTVHYVTHPPCSELLQARSSFCKKKKQ